MEFYKVSSLYLCKLVVLQRKNGELNFVEDKRNHLLILSEEPIDIRNPKAIYYNLRGETFYHGLQKGVYSNSDLNKCFVIERHDIPKIFFTKEELVEGKISENRLKILQENGVLRNLRW